MIMNQPRSAQAAIETLETGQSGDAPREGCIAHFEAICLSHGGRLVRGFPCPSFWPDDEDQRNQLWITVYAFTDRIGLQDEMLCQIIDDEANVAGILPAAAWPAWLLELVDRAEPHQVD